MSNIVHIIYMWCGTQNIRLAHPGQVLLWSKMTISAGDFLFLFLASITWRLKIVRHDHQLMLTPFSQFFLPENVARSTGEWWRWWVWIGDFVWVFCLCEILKWTWLDIITDYVKNLCSGEDGGLARCFASRASKAQPSHQVPLDWLLKSHLDCYQYFS